jgi:adenosylcobinamide kinase / adenosylcobinamide-phosphate guanylyltransferase
MSITLVGGGARSGKSRHALALARQTGPRLAFIATAQAYDAEMRDRIALHRAERGPEFTTFEEPLDLAAVLDREAANFDAIVVDCLTLWLTNVMLAGAAPPDPLPIAAASSARVILVTNEVGCGIVPDNALAREFRDRAGRLNQQAAEAAAEVWWMVFGLPLRVK